MDQLPPAMLPAEASLAPRESEAPPLAAFLGHYNRRLYRVARSILRNSEEAEDAVQDAYVHALSNLAALRDHANLEGWLVRITVNEALTRLRRRRSPLPLAEIAERLADDTAAATILLSPFGRQNPEEATVQSEVRSILEQAIDHLPTHFRMVFVACEIEGMSVAETAEALGLYQVTVKTRLYRARRLLRRNLDARFISALSSAFPCAGRRCERITAGVLARLAAHPATLPSSATSGEFSCNRHAAP